MSASPRCDPASPSVFFRRHGQRENIVNLPDVEQLKGSCGLDEHVGLLGFQFSRMIVRSKMKEAANSGFRCGRVGPVGRRYRNARVRLRLVMSVPSRTRSYGRGLDEAAINVGAAIDNDGLKDLRAAPCLRPQPGGESPFRNTACVQRVEVVATDFDGDLQQF